MSFPPCTRRCQRQHLNPPSLEGSGQFITALSLCQGEPLGHVCSIYTPVREEEWQSPPRGTAPGLARVPQLTFFSLESFGLRAFVVFSETFSFMAETPKLSVLGNTTGPGHGVKPCPITVQHLALSLTPFWPTAAGAAPDNAQTQFGGRHIPQAAHSRQFGYGQVLHRGLGPRVGAWLCHSGTVPA